MYSFALLFEVDLVNNLDICPKDAALRWCCDGLATSRPSQGRRRGPWTVAILISHLQAAKRDCTMLVGLKAMARKIAKLEVKLHDLWDD